MRILENQINKRLPLFLCLLLSFTTFNAQTLQKISCLEKNQGAPTEEYTLTHLEQLRSDLDSLKSIHRLQLYDQCIVDYALKYHPVYQTDWDTINLFPNLDPIEQGDSISIDILSESESFYYNDWGVFYWPYGPRWGRMHRGLDLGLLVGDSIVSTFNGIVRYARFNQGGYGNCVVIRHFNGIETLYAHMDEIHVKAGQLVMAKDLIGFGGTTGRSDGPHLHFETRYKGKSFDPLKIFGKESLCVEIDTLILTKKDITDPIKTRSKSSGKVHIVKSGESLSQIARKYRTSVSTLQRLNGISNPNKIKIGQRLRLP